MNIKIHTYKGIVTCKGVKKFFFNCFSKNITVVLDLDRGSIQKNNAEIIQARNNIFLILDIDYVESM